MGTSISHPSPTNIPNWDAVALAYDNDAIPIERLVRELWRAAQSEQIADWHDLLSAPIIATCKDIALQGLTPTQAGSQAAREIVRQRAGSLAGDIAQRAVIQSFSYDDRAQGFVQALFVGVSDYLVSRDVSGYVGATDRTSTAASLIRFKAAIRERVVEVVQQVGRPPAPTANSEWPSFIAAAVARLAS